MIEKRPPRVSDVPIADEEQVDAAGAPIEIEDFEDERPMHMDDHGMHDDDDEELDDEPTTDSVEEAERRKRNGNLILYGGMAAVIAVIAALVFPTIKKTFLKSEAPQQSASRVPVPEKARQNHFKLAQTDSSVPQAPSGAVDALAPIPGAGVAGQDGTPSIPGGQDRTSTPTGSVPLKGDVADSSIPPGASMAIGATPMVVAPPPALPPEPVKPEVAPSIINGVPPAGSSLAKEPVGQTYATTSAVSEVQTQLTDLTSKVTGLQTSLATLTSVGDTQQSRLLQMQASLDSLQRQIADMTAVRSVVKSDVKPAPVREAGAPHRVAVSHSDWTLRSATSDMALLGRPGSNDLQRVSVGDMVSGLGRITSISEQGGRWVVKGTSGSVVQ